MHIAADDEDPSNASDASNDKRIPRNDHCPLSIFIFIFKVVFIIFIIIVIMVMIVVIIVVVIVIVIVCVMCAPR